MGRKPYATAVVLVCYICKIQYWRQTCNIEVQLCSQRAS